MLLFLANVVPDGTRTSSGFMKVHLNACAKALSEFFNIQRSSNRISNHLNTWRKKYTKINLLKKISGAIWDEDHFIISLDHDHYTSYMEVT
jgi:methionine salvage enolase-phosphatase E1